ITGYGRFDFRIDPGSTPPMDRLRAHVAFAGPSATVAGYTATNARVTADVTGRRISLDGRANAYGGSATAKGFVTLPESGQPTVFDLSGSASHVNLSALPRRLSVPQITTNLNAQAYHVKGSAGLGASVEGSATLEQSTIADGTIMNGTAGEFAVTSGPRASASGVQTL